VGGFVGLVNLRQVGRKHVLGSMLRIC
jgi:hypothetical protein